MTPKKKRLTVAEVENALTQNKGDHILAARSLAVPLLAFDAFVRKHEKLSAHSEALYVELIATTLRESRGNITTAARALGIARNTLYTRIKNHPVLDEALSDSREELLDEAESALFNSVLTREPWAVCFTLKTIGRKRGYVEKKEIEHQASVGSSLLDEMADLFNGVFGDGNESSAQDAQAPGERSS